MIPRLSAVLSCAALLLAAACPAQGDEVLAVSFVRLLTDAERFEGERIEVFGYLAPHGRIYLTKDHAGARDGLSSVMVSDTDQGDIASSSCTESYVRIRGRLERVDTRSFIIADVERVFQPGAGVECWTPTRKVEN